MVETYLWPENVYSNRKGAVKHCKTLKEFRTILLGRILRIYTDHKNLTCKFFNTNRVLIWRLILEEYGPDIEYIQGDKNTVVYVLSIFLMNVNQETTQ